VRGLSQGLNRGPISLPGRRESRIGGATPSTTKSTVRPGSVMSARLDKDSTFDCPADGSAAPVALGARRRYCKTASLTELSPRRADELRLRRRSKQEDPRHVLMMSVSVDGFVAGAPRSRRRAPRARAAEALETRSRPSAANPAARSSPGAAPASRSPFRGPDSSTSTFSCSPRRLRGRPTHVSRPAQRPAAKPTRGPDLRHRHHAPRLRAKRPEMTRETRKDW
jgi:hypothetical protein